MNGLHKTTQIQIKLSPEAQERIQLKAERLNLDVSKFIRTVALSDDKIIVLDKGGYIARSLIEIQDILSCALRDGKIDDNLCRILCSRLNDIFDKFIKLTEQLTDISVIEGCDDGKEDE